MLDFATGLARTIWVARDSSKRRLQGFVICALAFHPHVTCGLRCTAGGKEVDMMTGADQSKLSRFVQKCAAGGASGGGGDVEASVEAGECTT